MTDRNMAFLDQRCFGRGNCYGDIRLASQFSPIIARKSNGFYALSTSLLHCRQNIRRIAARAYRNRDIHPAFPARLFGVPCFAVRIGYAPKSVGVSASLKPRRVTGLLFPLERAPVETLAPVQATSSSDRKAF